MADVQLNSALEDIQDIIVQKPELEPAEWEVVSKATDWMKSVLRPEVRKELEVVYAKKQAEFQTEMAAETKRMVKEHMDAWQKEQEPLSNDELKKLLSQEYTELPFPLKELRGEKKEYTFTICELPEVVEIKFIKAAQKFLIPLIEEINAAEWHLGSSLLEQIQSMLKQCPSAFDAAVEIVAIILNPWDENKYIDANWVKNNVSTGRISLILIAQIEANKYRDFLLNGFRSFRSLRKT